MNRDLVRQLQELGIQSLRVRRQASALGLFEQGLGCKLRQRNAMEQGGQLLQAAIKREAARIHQLGHFEHGLHVLRHQSVEQRKQVFVTHRAEHGAHALVLHLAGTVGDGLVEQGERIAHAAGGTLGQVAQGSRIEGHPFGL